MNSQEEDKIDGSEILNLNKTLDLRMKQICKVMVEEMCFHMNPVKGCFEIMAFQFVVDKKMNPVLVNINQNIDHNVILDYIILF
jgi:hypothetical protein